MLLIKKFPFQCYFFRQTLLFSATLPKTLVEFAKAGLNDPVLLRLDVDTKLSEQLKVHVYTENIYTVKSHPVFFLLTVFLMKILEELVYVFPFVACIFLCKGRRQKW